MKTAILRLLGTFGLLLPVFRGWEWLRAIGAQKAVDVAPDRLPLPPPQLIVRVSGTADIAWFLEGGELAETAIRGSLLRAGVEMTTLTSLLDFGCGCGRVLRRWHGLEARVHGSDLCEPAIEWCRANLPFVEANANALQPPLDYRDMSFDLIYALSVLTHLPAETQFAWRDEFARLLRPGGYLLLTLHGNAYVDRLRPEERTAYAEGQCVVRWAEVAGSNLCTAFHPPAFVRDRLASGWELVEHVASGALGNPEQDLVLLRKPVSSTGMSQEAAG